MINSFNGAANDSQAGTAQLLNHPLHHGLRVESGGEGGAGDALNQPAVLPGPAAGVELGNDKVSFMTIEGAELDCWPRGKRWMIEALRRGEGVGYAHLLKKDLSVCIVGAEGVEWVVVKPGKDVHGGSVAKPEGAASEKGGAP